MEPHNKRRFVKFYGLLIVLLMATTALYPNENVQEVFCPILFCLMFEKEEMAAISKMTLPLKLAHLDVQSQSLQVPLDFGTMRVIMVRKM